MTASSRITPTRSFVTTLCLAASVAAAASPGRGDQDVPDAFEVCLACHAYEPDEAPLEGPTLWGVVGRQIAGVDGGCFGKLGDIGHGLRGGLLSSVSGI